MARLFGNTEGTTEGKYLIKRRDGSVPEWPFFVLGARDPAAPAALRAYAAEAEAIGMDSAYVEDIRQLARDFNAYMCDHGLGNPDGPRHRPDDPETIAEMAKGSGA